MLLHLADTIEALFAPYDLAMLTHWFHGCPNFHANVVHEEANS